MMISFNFYDVLRNTLLEIEFSVKNLFFVLKFVIKK